MHRLYLEATENKTFKYHLIELVIVNDFLEDHKYELGHINYCVLKC